MSLYMPAGIASADLDVAQSPYFGGEFNVYLTTKPSILVGTVEILAVGNDALTGSQALGIPTPGVTLAGPPGVNLQMSLLTPCSDVKGVNFLEVNGICADGTGGDGADLNIDFAPPARVANQHFSFERGWAMDMSNAGNGKFVSFHWDAFFSVGGQVGVTFGIWQLPLLTDYTFIGCTTEIDFNTKSRVAKGIDCQMESDAFVKRGKTQPGELSIGSKFKSFAEGLARFDGLKTTCMMVGVKDGQVLDNRLVFTQYVPTIKGKLPEGDGEAMINGVGKFVEQLFFVAS